jgi:hypothetical protein
MDSISRALAKLRFYVGVIQETNPHPEWFARLERILSSVCAKHNGKVLARQEGMDLTRGSSDEDLSDEPGV